MRKSIQTTLALAALSFLIIFNSGCAPVTKATLKSAKGPKEYVIKSIDSAFLTDQNYAVVYSTVNKKGKDKVQIAVFKLMKTGVGESAEGYVPFDVMNNDAYKAAIKGTIVSTFRISTNSGDIFDGSDKPGILVEGILPNKKALLSIYPAPNDETWGRYSVAMEPHVKTRRPYMYALLPATVATDAAITATAVGVGVVAGVLALIYLGGRAIF